MENGLQGSALTIYLLVTVAIIVLLVFLWHILLKRSIKISTEIKYIQEVLFKSIEVREKGQTSSCFYEWNGMKFKEVKYDTISHRAEYGKIYIKYFSEKRMVVMVKK